MCVPRDRIGFVEYKTTVVALYFYICQTASSRSRCGPKFPIRARLSAAAACATSGIAVRARYWLMVVLGWRRF